MGSLQIASKTEFYRLSRQDLLGNRLVQWTWEEFRDRWIHQNTKYADTRLPVLIGVRVPAGVSAAVTGLYTPQEAIDLACRNLPASEVWLFDEGLPPELLTLSGEVVSHECHIWLRYSFERMHMRRIWEKQYNQRDYKTTKSGIIGKPCVLNASGMEAWGLIKRHMDNPSLECLYDILETYDHPIVEFGCCSRTVGIQRWNTIFWEVRTKY